MIVRNQRTGQVLGTAVRRADSFWLRLRGLMFRRALHPGEGLLILPCKAVHTHFMRIPIDVLFLDGSNRVLHLLARMEPWGQSPVVREAAAVLELAAGAAAGTRPGDQLILE